MIDAADVRAARARLAGIIAETPCPYSVTLSAMTGARVFLKLRGRRRDRERGGDRKRHPPLLLEIEKTVVEGVGRSHWPPWLPGGVALEGETVAPDPEQIAAIKRQLAEEGYAAEEVSPV
jgi:hypothetical protein